jgi:hypothetical protein
MRSSRINYYCFIAQFAELTIRNPELLEKMYSLYDCTKEANETIYMVVNFFSYVVKLPSRSSQKKLLIGSNSAYKRLG